jgi:hypothetical protein
MAANKEKCIPLNPWTGAIGGCLVTAILLLLGGTGILPWSFTEAVAVFAGGLAAGLITKGTGWDGSLAGAASGAVVALGTAVRLILLPSPGITTSGVAATSLITAAFFIPSNAVGGLIGIMVRNAIGHLEFSGAQGDPGRSRGAAYLRLAGTFACSLIIPASVFLTGSLSPLLAIPPLGGGFVAGSLSTGGMKRGAESGLLTGILGILILSLPLAWIGSRGTGFAAGLGGIILIVVTFFSLPSAMVGGIIGAYVRNKIREKSSRAY